MADKDMTAALSDPAPDAAAALTALALVRDQREALERGALRLLTAARAGGATWSAIAAATCADGRQTSQKRHADLSRRYARPPAVDNSQPALTASPSLRPVTWP
jgi:hypothetical protein